MKKVIFIFCIVLCIVLVGCNTQKESKQSNITSNPTSAPDIFVAQKKGTSVDAYDFQIAYTMCIQALREYQDARVNKKNIDLTKYIQDEKLISYMEKKLSSSKHYTNDGEVTRTGLVEFKVQHISETGFKEDRLYFYITWGNIIQGSGFSTTTEFIVKNSNGKLVIAEWYDKDKDTFDTICRGNIDIEKEDIYWNNADATLLQKIIADYKE